MHAGCGRPALQNDHEHSGKNVNKQSAVPLQEFWRRMDHLVELNTKLVALGKSDSPFKNLQKAPIVAAMAGEILALYNGKTIRSGSFDLMPETQLAY